MTVRQQTTCAYRLILFIVSNSMQTLGIHHIPFQLNRNMLLNHKTE
jgi:hypothetical protein